LVSVPVVTTEWVSKHLADPSVTIVEVNTDPDAGYNTGHIPGALLWNLHVDLENELRRDVPDLSQMEKLLSRSGITNESIIVLYGDGNNRSATWAFWVLKIYRHENVLIMDGGRKKWLIEERQMSSLTPSSRFNEYKMLVPDFSVRATKNHILSRLGDPKLQILDTRTNEEFVGGYSSSPDKGQAAIYRAGRIPGAVHFPWDDSATEDGLFRPVEQLKALYSECGISSSKEVVTYCRLGVRASYSWFVLKYLLKFPFVKNYDGSWTEWGNAINVPIDRG
jgi:thiosulfate/3-mercaptopyruvate sulfurtransferase